MENYQLLQERHDYNMDGLFSPHGLQAEKTDHFWAEEFLIKKVEERWIAINTKRLIAAYVKKKLEIESLSIPLMVSEPYPYKGIQEKTILALNDKGFEFEKLGPDTLVMRAIPEWMNGFPLRDVASILLRLENFESLQVRASDWSTSIWEEMIQCLGTTHLMKENILCGLEETLRGKLR